MTEMFDAWSLLTKEVTQSRTPTLDATVVVNKEAPILVDDEKTILAKSFGLSLLASALTNRLESGNETLPKSVEQLIDLIKSVSVPGPQGDPGPAGPAGPEGQIGPKAFGFIARPGKYYSPGASLVYTPTSMTRTADRFYAYPFISGANMTVNEILAIMNFSGSDLGKLHYAIFEADDSTDFSGRILSSGSLQLPLSGTNVKVRVPLDSPASLIAGRPYYLCSFADALSVTISANIHSTEQNMAMMRGWDGLNGSNFPVSGYTIPLVNGSFPPDLSVVPSTDWYGSSYVISGFLKVAS